ncbi:hypothetical protein Pfo_022564 [Paulownia fortunei]|nr:hypothetical protein Pfo_022564 [Paulownia fortunei]
MISNMLLLSLVMSSLVIVSAGDFYRDIDITWGDQRAKILNGGQLLTLSLDKFSGSGFQSKNQYLFGRVDMQLKLVLGNSAGTVTTYYVQHMMRLTFEFLGNLSGQPYTVHTNVYTQGKGNREQQFRLWFDPTIAFHTYSIVWNPQRIIFLVDNIPIRVFRNNEAIGVPYPKSQPMRVYSSLWDADDWATQGGRVKTDWTRAPFTAMYQNFNANACVWPSTTCVSKSAATNSMPTNGWMYQELDVSGQKKLQWVQKNYMIYNYCTDYKRFPQGLPPECRQSRLL